MAFVPEVLRQATVRVAAVGASDDLVEPGADPFCFLSLGVFGGGVDLPYLGPALDTDTRVEVVDHVVPGVVLLAVSSVAWVLGPRLRTPTIAPLVTGLAVLLVGLWMFATQVPLVAQALRDEVPAERSHPHDTSGGREGVAEGSACAMIITMTDPDIERGRPDEAAVSRLADRDGRRPGRRFGRLGMLAGACAALPVLLGPNLNVAHQVEIADHLIPAVVVLAVSAMVLVMNRTAPVSGGVVRVSGLVVALAGLWMVATHLPLVAQAARHQAPWAATIYHSGSAVLVLALGLVWTGASWAEVA